MVIYIRFLLDNINYSVIYHYYLCRISLVFNSFYDLASLYHEVQFWLTLRAVRTYLEDENTEWNKFEIRRLPSIVWELNKQAEEDFLVERSRVSHISRCFLLASNELGAI